jgi:beta-glucosidase
MSHKLKKLIALFLVVCLGLTSAFALADPAQLGSSLVEATGTVPGDLDADGYFYADYSSIDEAMEAGSRLHLQMVEEGRVLLKNENNALPLSSDERDVTFLGIGSVDYVRAGGGSGSSTGTSYALDWFNAFEQEGFHVNPKTEELYENLFSVLGGAHDPASSGGLLEQDMSYYSKSVVSTFSSYDDVAIVCISRYGREDLDLETNNIEGHSDPNDHYLQLDDNELALIKMAKADFKKAVVMINSSNIMQIPELQASTDTEYGVDAILWVGGIGDQGTLAAAEILTGEVNPSGHTPDLWSGDFTKDPTFTNFSDMSQNVDEDGNRMSSWLTCSDGSDSVYSDVEFREGIYYGYRYCETKADDMNAAEAGSGDAWYQENVLYPFGYGLSYTSFDWELAGISDQTITAANQTITMQVKVTNTGAAAGKDAVQLYATTPYDTGGIEKASAVLVGYAKTDMLQPG